MKRSGLAVLILLGGCDAVFGLGEPGDAGGGEVIAPGDGRAPDGPPIEDGGALDAATLPVCTTDDFSADRGGWALLYGGACTPELCALGVQAGTLITKLGAAGTLKATLNPGVDFDGGSVTLDAFPSLTPSSSVQLRIATSSTDVLGVGISTDASGFATLEVTRSGSGGVVPPTPYDADAHRHWKIEHVTSGINGKQLVVSTQATVGGIWTERARVAAPADVSNTFVQLEVRRTTSTTGSNTDDSVTSFDDLAVCAR